MARPKSRCLLAVPRKTDLYLKVPECDPVNHVAEIRKIQVNDADRKAVTTMLSGKNGQLAKDLFPGPQGFRYTTPDSPDAPCTVTLVVTIWHKKDLKRDTRAPFHSRVCVHTWVLRVE